MQPRKLKSGQRRSSPGDHKRLPIHLDEAHAAVALSLKSYATAQTKLHDRAAHATDLAASRTFRVA